MANIFNIEIGQIYFRTQSMTKLDIYGSITESCLDCYIASSPPLVGAYMACNRRKENFGRLRKVSFQISLCSLHRLICNGIFRFMHFFCLQQVYCSTKSNGVVKCRLGLACANNLRRHFTQMSESPFLRIASHIVK